MVELRFRIRNNVFNLLESPRRGTIRPLSFRVRSVEEAALLSEVDETGRVIPRGEVFFLTNLPTGPVIGGFQDCALGEFIKAQLEALSQNGKPPAKCEVYGLDQFLNFEQTDQAEELRDIISVCEFRSHECTLESVVRFLKESGFLDEYIIVGIKRGNGWRRLQCLTTFEAQPSDAATALGHLADYFQKEAEDDRPHDDRYV
jgi:hypothetical protein